MAAPLFADEPCSAGRNMDVAQPFEAALVAIRLGRAIPSRMETGAASNGCATSRFRPAEQGLISEKGSRHEMAQIKKLEGMEASAFLKTTPPNLGAFKSLFSFVMWHVRNHTKIIRSNRLIREFCVLFPAPQHTYRVIRGSCPHSRFCVRVLFPAPQHTRHPLRGTSLGATGSSLNLRRYLDLDSLSKSSIKIFENFAQR